MSQSLPDPAHAGVEHQKQGERDADNRQRIQCLVRDDSVKDDLRAQRRGQRHELDPKRCQQDVAPDLLVLEQLGNEPGKPECFLAPGRDVGIGIGERLCLGRKQYQLARIALVEIGCGERHPTRCARFEHYDVLVIGLDYYRQGMRRFPAALALPGMGFVRAFGFRFRRPEHGHAGQRHVLDFVCGARLPLRLQAQRRSGLEQSRCRMRRGKLLRYEFGRKRDALELADRTQSPDEMHASQRHIERHRRPLTGLWPNSQTLRVARKISRFNWPFG